MTILEQLREKKKDLTMDSKGFNLLCDLLREYDLALENALLKLKNRGVEVADLKHRIKEKIDGDKIEKIIHQWVNNKNSSVFVCNAGKRNLALTIAEKLNY